MPAVRVGYADGALGEEAPVATTDVLGYFDLVLPEAAAALQRQEGGEWGEPLRLECKDPDWLTLLGGVERDGVLDVVVGPAVGVAGSVVDTAGDPIEGAAVRFVLRQSLFRELGVIRPWGNDGSMPSVQSDEWGNFVLDRAAGGLLVGLLVEANGYTSVQVDVPPGGDTALRVVMAVLDDEQLIEGQVVDAEGAPVPAALISVGNEIVRASDDGHFRLAWRLQGAGDHKQGADGIWRAGGDTSLLTAAKAGHLPVRVAVADLDLSKTVVLRLGGQPLAIAGRVVDENGEPRKGVVLWESDTTSFGHFVRDTGGARAHMNVTLEGMTRSEDGTEGAVSADDGTFRLAGLLQRDYELHAYDPPSATRGGPWVVAAGSTSVEIVVATEPGTQRVAGRVTSASGTPLSGVFLRPVRPQFEGGAPPWIPGVPTGQNTDEEGRFEFDALATDETVLELQHESFFIRSVALKDYADLTAMEIVQPSLCELQVELYDANLADSLEVLDETGEPLELLEHFGAFLGAGRNAGFEDGKTNVLQILETARTLVLSKGGVEVLRQRLDLNVEERTVLRL